MDPLPKSIGIIMDGNRRWAKAKGLLPWEGHGKGKEKFRELMRWAVKRDIRAITCYAFSTENWNRPTEEITAIESLLVTVLQQDLPELIDEKISLRFIGERERFSQKTQQLMKEAEEKTKHGAYVVAIALSYGGRAEIAAAAQLASKTGVITEEEISKHLWTTGMPDPDLIIRTGGQQRLSNFLLWQAAYSELWFTNTLWPDFSEIEFDEALSFYANTKRNFGS